MLNRVVLIGRLTKDPQLRYTQTQVAVCSFTLAVDRNYKQVNGERVTDFFDVTVWRGQAENCANYLSKGKLAAVDGHIEMEEYTANDGMNRRAVKIVADNVRFLSPRGTENNAAPSATAPEWVADASDDDLPF